MKRVTHAYIVADQDRAALLALKTTLAQMEGAPPKVDYRLHAVIRIGESVIVLVPDRGIMAPTSPDARPPTKRDLPWLPSEVVWVPSGELSRRKEEERGWTQARLADVRSLLSDAGAVTLVSSSDRSKHALDELAIELPEDRRMRAVRLPAGALPEAVAEALTHARSYSPPREMITARRTCLALDYLASMNFRIGVSTCLRDAKVGPDKGLRLTLIKAGILGAISLTGNEDASQRMGWRREVIVQREGGEEMLALDARDPLPLDLSYRDILSRRPASGVWGSIVESEPSDLTIQPPAPLTVGGLIRAGVEIINLAQALGYLSGAGLVAHAWDAGKGYPPADRALIERAMSLLPEGFDREALRRALGRELPPAAVAARYAITPIVGSRDVPDLGERQRSLWQLILRRWVQHLAGPARVRRRRIAAHLAGMTFATWTYDEVLEPGWVEHAPPLSDPALWRVGERVRVVESVVEPKFPPARSLSELIDGLSLAWQTTAWERERVPGAVVASPRSLLTAFASLVEEELVGVDGDRAHLTALGKQVLAFLPAELRHPAWIANLRSSAQRASSEAARRMVRGDLDNAIVRYAQRLPTVAVTVAPRVWTEETPSTAGAAEGAVGGRSGLELDTKESARASVPSDDRH
ncbi:hypothetical protein EPN42_03650 [bacterium]|nr:MAG: hypothetical protein EPN42_03650 [bacterium]